MKELNKLKVDGDLSGIFYSFFNALIGLVCLIVYIIFGGMAGVEFSWADYFLIFLGGTTEGVGIIVQIYAASIGIAGIAFGIANTCCIYVTLFNYLARSVPITVAQVTGIVFTLGGASVIALEEQIQSMLFKKQIKQEPIRQM